jgi:hypothetical protein
MRSHVPLRRVAAVVAGLVATATLTGCFAVVRPPPPPPGVYTGWGFDTCQAPNAGVMQAWLQSPFRSIGIYIGGANQACSQPNLNPGWVSTVGNSGWHMAPLYVGLQSYCAFQGGLAVMSQNWSAAYSQGAASADDAVSHSSSLGFGPGTPIYFDMEAYNSSDAPCVEVTRAFVTAWTNQLHALGYIAAYYSSSASGIRDEALTIGHAGYSQPDAVWFANWNYLGNIFGDPYFPDSAWPNHQRLHQYAGGHPEGWGGYVLDIDSDIDDGPLAA